MTTESKFDCVFCKEVFDDKETLLVHFRKHGDPNFNSNTKNKIRPQNDIPTTEKSAEEVEVVGCDVCDEVFPTISKAITHKHKAHPDHDAKYFCPFCGKLFTMKHLYNKHIQSNHDSSEVTSSKEFHCDSCVVSFYIPSAMLYHNKFFHRQDTDLPAVGQSKKVKIYNQEMVQIYYCAFCGEEYNNKVNLHKHMGDDHGDENQSPSDILRCPLCEAIFYHLDAYEIHLTFHSTDDLYSEQNELVKSVTEFSLETVAPIMEKVEEEQQEEDANNLNSDGIENFLQLVMGESADNDVPEKVKSKKHKKHKKSKKASITLDEFLNMNKDVFGDGLNVQGIEEVPTQVVLKKVKGKKMATKNEQKMVNADLAKLKKQGIVVKTKSGIKPLLKNLKKEENKSKSISTPNEILSKLMNQGNSQIKVIKKTVSQNSTNDEDTNNSPESSVSIPNHADTNKDGVSDLEDENLSKIHDIPTVESETNENREELDKLHEKEDIMKCDASTPFDSNEKTFENQDHKEESEKNENTNIENIDNGIGTAKTLNTLVEQNAIASSPSRLTLSRSLLNAKQNPAEYNLYNQETSKVDNNDYNSTKDEEHNLDNKTLNALKHLSSLITVKSVSQGKPTNESCKTKENNDNDTLETKNDDNESNCTKQNSKEQNLALKPPALSKLGEHITIKPSKQSPFLPSFDSGDENKDNEYNDANEDISEEFEDRVDETKNKNLIDIKPVTVKNFPSQGKNSKNQANEPDDEKELITDDCPKRASNLDILKRLTNVTAKPISNVSPNINQRASVKQVNVTPLKEELPKNLNKSSIDEEVEIFNIDDSDSEENETDAVIKKVEEKPCPVTATLRNLGKNIVVKSNQQNVIVSDVKEKRLDSENTRIDSRSENIRINKQSSDIQRSINLQNKLKVLGSNVTVKSRNSSPNTYNKEAFRNFEDYDDDEEDEANFSGSESNIGKVKIAEMNDDDISDNECNGSQSNAIVESPNASNSENEDNHEDINDEFSDVESQITNTVLKKDNPTAVLTKNTCLENFRNLNKELTIKSLNTKKQDPEDETNLLHQKEISENIPNTNKQLAVKQLKPNSSQSEQSISKSSQQSSGSMSQAQAFNKKVSTSSNQVNTVKTVKRFQSQTVIEEITTTVTKTIRTVNQSSNEVVQNRCASNPVIRPQKIINKQPGKELHGTSVRHASPTIGTKIRNATNTVRHPNPNTIRPSNQLVPVRPHLNVPRAAGPSTSGVRKAAPPRCSLQKPAIGKLKISPHALNQATKRPSDEATGPFSCFKKPREALINSDALDFDDDPAGTAQFSMASQSRSDFATVTKTVKGRGMVTATQTRSEVSTSSKQQLNRLSNVSGLKIMKSSAKQATHVEEKCEISTTNKNTLDALERLQKQGLLIKKPRIDDHNEEQATRNSFSGSDDEENDNC